MDELIRQLTVRSSEGLASFTYAEFVLSLVLSFALASALSWVYRATHVGLSTPRSFSVTMILMSTTVAFIMLIIGSNLARAFSLVGALSIIRFRNAVRDPRDTAFIFLTMAVGMACGVRLYVQAVLFTATLSGLILALDRVSFGSAHREERLLRFALAEGASADGAIEDSLRATLQGRFALLSSEVAAGRRVLLYSVELQEERATARWLEALAERLPGVDVRMITGFEKFTV